MKKILYAVNLFFLFFSTCKGNEDFIPFANFFENDVLDEQSISLPLYYWQAHSFMNFGDYLSLKLVERIVGVPIDVYKKTTHKNQKKLLAIGSIISVASDNDVIWGSGINGKSLDKKKYNFTKLDVRAVRGPLTREFLRNNFKIDCPPIYGDPALLMPYFFPEFKRKKKPKYDFIVIPHYSEQDFFPKTVFDNIVYPTEPWNEVIEKILDSKFVISSSLHGIIIAEAFGIPARMLKITDHEPIFKYKDYYLGTNRPDFRYATSVSQALEMKGEKPFQCDLQKLYSVFPFELWNLEVPISLLSSIIDTQNLSIIEN